MNFKLVPNERVHYYLKICREPRCYNHKHKSYISKCTKMRIKRRENRCSCSYNFNVPDYNVLAHGQIVDDVILYQYISHNTTGKRPPTDPPNTVFDKQPS